MTGAPAGVADRWPWPLGVEAGWSSIRTDATWHAVYWIAEWPRGGVGSGFLLPLLLEGGLRRTIAVTMAPVSPLRAVRRAEHDRTSGAADAELRRRHGFAVTARTRHEHEATTRREIELAEGHAAFRFTGYLAVTADDETALAAACGRIEQTAARAQLELHRMYGAQEEGLDLHPADRERVRMRLPAHESTTAQLGAAYPFAASAPLPASRVLIGQDLAGGPFAHDPFELYAAGTVTNPNVTVLGQIGRGKSALVKTYLLRQAAFGRQVAVLDPKGEYGALARALGSSPLSLAPGGPIRVNPLDAPSAPPAMGVERHRLVLLGTLAAACLRRPLSPREHTALELALGAATRAHEGRAHGPADAARRRLVASSTACRVGADRRYDEGQRSSSTVGTWASSCVASSRATSPVCSTARRRRASINAPACSSSISPPSTTPRPSVPSWCAPPPGCRR